IAKTRGKITAGRDDLPGLLARGGGLMALTARVRGSPTFCPYRIRIRDARLELISKLRVHHRLAMGPILGDAVFHAGAFEVPAGIGPPRRKVDTLPVRQMVRQAVSAVEVAPRPPLHAFVILSHIQIHRATIP